MRYNSLRCTKLSTPCRGVNRTFASSAPSYARSRPQGPEGSSEERGGPSRKRDSDNAGQPTGISFDSWMAKIGSQFKEPLPGRTNWLGGTCPFPLNPTFKPPPPISDGMKQAIFNAYAEDQELNSIRALSLRFGISLKRVEAIIRLKALEFKWRKESRPLRTNFLMGMESSLGVIPFKPSTVTTSLAQTYNSNTDLADRAAEADANIIVDHTLRGIPKMYWEGVEDGKEPYIAPLLATEADEQAQKVADAMAASAAFLASHQKVVPPKVDGRAPVVFVDVGKKFMDMRDEKKREKAADARKRLRERKEQRKVKATT